MDPTDLMRLPRSEYAKRRQYYLSWRQAQEGTSTKDGVTIEGDWDS
jgi:hypothetical protein